MRRERCCNDEWLFKKNDKFLYNNSTISETDFYDSKKGKREQCVKGTEGFGIDHVMQCLQTACIHSIWCIENQKMRCKSNHHFFCPSSTCIKNSVNKYKDRNITLQQL